MADHIVIERSGQAWAVKHNDSFLGLARSREAAALIAQDLAEWIAERGGAPAPPEARSFAPREDQKPSAALAATSAAASPPGE